VKDATRDELMIQVYDFDTNTSNDKIGDKFKISVIDVCKKGGVIEDWMMPVPGSKTTKLVLTLAYRESA